MAYHERRLPKPSRASIEIDGEAYDIDVIGQDDGRDPDPDASFRLLLQLGQGLMIYVYVIGMARPRYSCAACDPRARRTVSEPMPVAGTSSAAGVTNVTPGRPCTLTR